MVFNPDAELRLNAGIVVNLRQFANMLVVSVTNDVLNKGTLTNELQPLNMELIFVTAEVLNNGTLFNE